MAPFRRRLVIMAKAPIAGAVKTRLAREVGSVAATGFARHAAAALFARLGHDRRWQTSIAVTPDPSAASWLWPMGAVIIGQGRGDLGQRMQRLADRVPLGPLVIVGTDIPKIAPQHIATAFARLGSCEAVFGPAADGGYWLVGLRRRPRRLTPFRRVRWSSAQALSDTVANLTGRSIAMLATLTDIDSAETLAAHAAGFARRVRPPA